jgi:hypothetical protein
MARGAGTANGGRVRIDDKPGESRRDPTLIGSRFMHSSAPAAAARWRLNSASNTRRTLAIKEPALSPLRPEPTRFPTQLPPIRRQAAPVPEFAAFASEAGNCTPSAGYVSYNLNYFTKRAHC